MSKEQDLGMLRTLLQRQKDYTGHDIVAERKKLVALWRAAHPEAVVEPPSAAHHMLELYSKRGPGDIPDDPDETWTNDIYNVTLRRKPDKCFGTKEMVHLGISTHDGTARHDWREFQWIKNQLVGPECEAFELFPAESRSLDPSNYYSLWCFPQLKAIRVGRFEERRVWDADEAMAPQRRFAKEE